MSGKPTPTITADEARERLVFLSAGLALTHDEIRARWPAWHAQREAARPSLRESPTPWLNEPNERSWIDGETGYYCLLLRGPSGAWCGYVGVSQAHPAHGLHYYREDVSIADVLAGRVDMAKLQAQERLNEVEVHGGLTFSGERRHPDAPEGAHWFGFDCSHAGDFCPKYEQASQLGLPTGWGGVIEYRTIQYAEEQCRSLALQLKALQAQASTGNARDGSSPQNPGDA